MKRTFVIDENVYVFFHTQQNEKGIEDLSSLRVVESAIANCHSIALSPELYRRYSQKHTVIQTGGRRASPRSLISLLRDALAFPPKGVLVVDAPPLTREGEFHDDDIPVVRIAAAAKAILVTTDDRLIKCLNESGIPEEHGFKALRPEAAMGLAGPTDS